jgi:formylglycine-generating enzyme required for sulfatase activity
VGIGEREDAAMKPAAKDRKINDTFWWGTQWPPPKGSGNYAGEEMRAALAGGKYSNIKGVIVGYNDAYVNTSPVGTYAPNRFGLYDIGGNVWQWCEDWFDESQKGRVLRGASWHESDRTDLLSSSRLYFAPGYRFYVQGFRCVLAPVPAPPAR